MTCNYEYEHAKKIEAAKAEREHQRRIRACAPEMLAMLVELYELADADLLHAEEAWNRVEELIKKAKGE